MKESVQRAFSYVQAKKSDLGIARDLDTSDLHVEVIDLLANRVEAEVGVAFFVACYSAMRKAPVNAALLVLGDMSVQGNIKPLRSLTEPLQIAKDNGANWQRLGPDRTSLRRRLGAKGNGVYCSRKIIPETIRQNASDRVKVKRHDGTLQRLLDLWQRGLRAAQYFYWESLGSILKDGRLGSVIEDADVPLLSNPYGKITPLDTTSVICHFSQRGVISCDFSPPELALSTMSRSFATAHTNQDDKCEVAPRNDTGDTFSAAS